MTNEAAAFTNSTNFNYNYRFDRETTPIGTGLGIRTLSQRYFTSTPAALEPGSWLAKDAAAPTANPLDVFGRPLKEGPVVSTADSYQQKASAYDAAGNQTDRGLAGANTQTFTWDAFGRLLQVSQRDAASGGFNLTSVYDGLGRRVKTVQQPVVAGVASGTPKVVESFFDPQVEFLELGVAVDGNRV